MSNRKNTIRIVINTFYKTVQKLSGNAIRKHQVSGYKKLQNNEECTRGNHKEAPKFAVSAKKG